MFLRMNLITNREKFCTCCCLGENFALVPIFCYAVSSARCQVEIFNAKDWVEMLNLALKKY